MASIAKGIETITDRIPDAYDRPARLYPGLIVLSPIAVMLVCLYGQQKLLLSSFLAVMASCGCAYALTRLVRNAGHRLQASLFAAWGGAPTTQLLRHANEHFDIHTKERFHKALSKALGKKLPTADEELRDPKAADELYRAAAVWLISQTRDTKKFPLIFKENIAFGFHRNALGIRAFGITIALGCLLYSIVATEIQGGWPALQSPSASTLVSLLYSSVLAGAWGFVFTEAAVKRAGFSYGERLLQSLDTIGAPARGKTTKEQNKE